MPGLTWPRMEDEEVVGAIARRVVLRYLTPGKPPSSKMGAGPRSSARRRLSSVVFSCIERKISVVSALALREPKGIILLCR